MKAIEPRIKRWTSSEYYELADLGWFRDQRVELIDGEIIQLPPQKDVHAATISLTAEALSKSFGNGFWVRQQLPLHLGETSEPEPDVAVVKGAIRDYVGTGHPRTALLVVEVSDATLRYDSGAKASFYAAHAIADYWLVNLQEWRLEVHRNPIPAAGRRFGFWFREIAYYDKVDTVTPLAAPASPLAVAELLP